MKPVRRAVALSLIAFALPACGGDTAVLATTTTTVAATTTAPSTTTTVTTTTSTTSTTTTTTTTTTPTTTATTTTIPVSRCEGKGSKTVPGGATYLSQMPGSFDGDPQPESIMHADSAFIVQSGSDYLFGFHLYIEYETYIKLPAPTNPGFIPEIVAVRDFGSLDDGVLVHLDQPLLYNGGVYAFFYLDADCHVVEAGTPATNPLEFLVGGGAAHEEGIECTATGVVGKQAGATGAIESDPWQVTETTYDWDPAGTGFTEDGVIGYMVPYNDPGMKVSLVENC